MMFDFYFLNPLTNPIFLEVMKRFAITIIAGFFLILFLNRMKFRGIWKTELGLRLLSWLGIGLIYFIAIFVGGYVALAFILVLVIMAVNEIKRMSGMSQAYTNALYLLSIISILVATFYPKMFLLLPLIYLIILGIVAIKQNKREGLLFLTIALFASIWIIFTWSHLILLTQLNDVLDNTKALLVLVGFAIAFSDIGAYLVGKSFAKTSLNKYKIAENISPNKTYVGILGNILGAAGGIAISYFAIQSYFLISHLVILSILIGLSSVVGDFLESLFKRQFDQKDSGGTIPGHGGILDRIDSFVIVLVVFYYYVSFILAGSI